MNPFSVVNRVGKYLASVGSTTAQNPAQWFVDWVRGGVESDSGVPVNYTTAMMIATVWQANNIISGDVGQLPLCLYKRTSEGREKATKHKAYPLLRYRANRWMNACVFKETVQTQINMFSNGRAGIVRNGRGEPIELVPFLPDRSREEVKDGELYHVTLLGEDMVEKWYRDRDVLHIKGLGDGLSGMSVIDKARNSWGLILAQEKHGNRTFKNQARPSMILLAENQFTREAAMQLLSDWDAYNTGDNIGRTALLQRGVKAMPMTMTNDVTQWIESRAFAIKEVASWFNLPPHKLSDGDRAGYNGLEHEQLTYFSGTLNRWTNAWCEECHEKLLTEEEKASGDYYFEFNTAALLRSDLKTRYDAYAQGITNEWLSPNDVREMENLNKRPGGDTYRNPNRKPETEKPAKNESYARLVRVEMNRVTAAAKTSKNFVSWLDKFYTKWEPRLAEALWSELDAAAHCQESKDALLDLCGRCTPANLAVEVQALVMNWEDRCN